MFKVLNHPVALAGVALLVISLVAWVWAPRIATAPSRAKSTAPVLRRISAGGVLLGLLLAAWGYLPAGRLGDIRSGATGPASSASPEIDYGFVELDHGSIPVTVTSYKHGGVMQVQAGQILQYQVVGDAPLPPLELHFAALVTPLPGIAGQIRIEGPAGKPLPAALRASGERLSLPGAAPPRISVKVQLLADRASGNGNTATP